MLKLIHYLIKNKEPLRCACAKGSFLETIKLQLMLHTNLSSDKFLGFLFAPEKKETIDIRR